MNTILEWLAVQSHRGYLYRLAGVVGVLAIGAGWLTDGQLATILTGLGLVLGVGGNGLASVHAPIKARKKG